MIQKDFDKLPEWIDGYGIAVNGLYVWFNDKGYTINPRMDITRPILMFDDPITNLNSIDELVSITYRV